MCYLIQVKALQSFSNDFLKYSKNNFNSTLFFSTLVKQNANNKMYFLNHLTHKTINAFCFIKCKHSALSVICYLNQVKQCRISAMFCLSYAKANTTGVMCFTMHVKQKCFFKSCGTQNI